VYTSCGRGATNAAGATRRTGVQRAVNHCMLPQLRRRAAIVL
jgi:hypothetical protein